MLNNMCVVEDYSNDIVINWDRLLSILSITNYSD